MSDFGGKNVQNSMSAGALPQTPFRSLQRSFAGVAYSAPLDSLAAFKGPYFYKGGEGEGG